MLQNLNWENYLSLCDLVDKYHYKEWFSINALVTWRYYGLNLKYNIVNNVIFFYINLNDKKTLDIYKNKWFLFSCYYFETTNKEWFINQAKNDLIDLNGTDELIFNNISIEMINFLSLDINNLKLEDYISNYIYYLDDMKTFKGKKMQKKRNHLNYFISQNYDYKIKNIKEINKDEIFNFIKNHIMNDDGEKRDYEIEICHKFIYDQMDLDKRYSGSVIYINQKIEAVTLGFINNNIYDVIIEKANKNIRGLYQFLIKSNLESNNINCLYMDREDDAFDKSLAKSKDSYHPIIKVQRYSSNIEDNKEI